VARIMHAAYRPRPCSAGQLAGLRRERVSGPLARESQLPVIDKKAGHSPGVARPESAQICPRRVGAGVATSVVASLQVGRTSAPASAASARLKVRVWRPLTAAQDPARHAPLGRRSGLTYKGLLKLFHKARDGASLEDVTFHALRHTFASILIAQGRDVQFVSRQLGHTKTSTTWDTYVHLFDAQRHAQHARDQLDAEYGGMLGGTTDA
jgi:hypothetical protein